MSGDIGIHEETVVFYDKTMTETKMVLLNLKGIKPVSYTHLTLPTKA